MEKNYISINLPNLVSVAIIAGVLATAFCALRMWGKPKPVSADAA